MSWPDSIIFLIFEVVPSKSHPVPAGVSTGSEYVVYCPILSIDTAYDKRTPLAGGRGLPIICSKGGHLTVNLCMKQAL